MYVERLNIPIGTNVMNARKYVESSKKNKRRRTMRNKRRTSTLPTHILFPTMVIPKLPSKLLLTLLQVMMIFIDEPILDESFDMHIVGSHSRKQNLFPTRYSQNLAQEEGHED
jgi:hypothetical protein